MSFDYAPMVATARRLIDRFGTDATLVQFGGGDATNPARPWEGAGASASTVQVRVVLDDYGVMERAVTGIADRDRKVLMEPGVAVPGTGDDLVVDGTVYDVVSVKETAPGGVPLLYTVQARA